MDTTGGYQSLLGLTSINSNSSTIDILNVENITIDGVIDLSQAIVGGLTTSQIDEGHNLYYTETRVSENPNVSSNTTHRERKDNPHGVTAAQVGIQNTDDIIEGVTNLYYTDIRFDDRLATKTTTSLAEGANLYYTTTRANADFDTRFGIKTTTDLTEGTNLYYTTTRANADFDTRLATKTTDDLTEASNLYYTDVRFDNRLAIKTTDDLTEASNLYYTDARFDARFGIKTTTNLTEGTNLYYTDARFDARFGTKTTDDLTEGKNNIYYTEARVSANTDVKANTTYRNTGHLPLTGGTLTGNLNMGNQDIDNVNQIFIDRKGLANNKLVLWDSGTPSTTDFYGFGIQNYTLMYNTYASTDNHKFYYSGTNELFRIGHAGVFSYRNLSVTGNITISGTVDGVDVATLNTNTTNHIENTNNPHGVLATQIADFDTEVSANADVKANTAYTAVGHLPLDGGTLTGDLDMKYNTIKGVNLIEIRENETTPVWTSNTTNESKGWYLATSNNDRLPVYLAFNNTYGPSAGSNDAWFPPDTTGNYNTDGTVNTASIPTTTLADTTVLYGEWIQIANTNRQIQMTSFILATRNHGYYSYPTDVTIIGSQDGTSWYVVYETTGLTFSSQAEFKTIVTPPNGNYKYFRFIVQRVRSTVTGNVSAGYPRIGEWRPSFVYSGNLDSALIEDVKTNTAYTAIGHLPLDGGTLTGDLTIDGELNIGGEKITRGATNGLQLYGPSSDIGGPHIQAFVSTDDYPVFQQLNNSHGSIAMCFDAYADGFTWKSSSTSNAIIYKSNTDLEFSYSSGIAVGDVVTWNAGFSMDLANGLVSFSNGLDVTGDLTVSGTVDGVDLKALETDVKANTAYRNTGHLPLSGGTITGDLNMGNNSIDNINQIFVDRKSAANNKIVLYDGGTPSTTNFYGFGVQSATLLYNVDSSAANHKFYYGGTNELFRIGDAAVYSYRGLDVKGNITVSGTVDGVDVAALKSAVDTNTAKVSADGTINTHSDVNITTPTDGHVLTYTSGEWKNIAPAAADGYLPLDGTTAMTGTLNINPSNHGEKLVFYKTDPTEVPYGIQTSNGFIMHGVEYNGSHVFIYDIDGKLATAGYLLQLKRTGSIMNTELSMNNHKITNLTTPTDTADATTKGYVDTAVNTKLSVNGTSIMIGNLNMGNYDIDNVNQVFVNRSGLANNKLVLLDNGSGSTTDFYGFGIGAATLMYNINSTGANHKFYYAGIYELFRIGHEGVYSYRNLDVTGNITVSGNVDGVDLKALNTTVGGKLSLTGGTMSGNIDMGGYNINTVGTVDGYNLNTLNSNINSKLPLTGGVITNGSINIYTQGRSGSHGAVKGLYVTSDFGAYSSGAEFRHSNGTQGIGIGYSGIYACGSNGSQDLNISSKGTGTINLHQNGWNYAVIRRRPSYNNEAQMSFRMSGNGGCGEIGYNGALVAWASSNQAGNPTGGIVYLSTNSSSWVGASDLRLKCDIVGLEVEDCCARIALLKPCNYCWKADETKKRNTGFIADEVKQVYPDLVSDSNINVGDDENIEGIDYTGMIPILVGAIQSMMGKMNELKNRIEILESPIV